MKRVFAKKIGSVIQIMMLMLFVNSICMAGVDPKPFDNVDAFKEEAGGLKTIDFETYRDDETGDDKPVESLSTYPTISGNEWSNMGIQFSAMESGENLFLYDDPASKKEYFSPIHALVPTGDRSSTKITFSTPVASFGVYIVGNETGSLTERIILKDDIGTVLGDYRMPYGGGDDDAYFRGYISTIPIAEVHIIEDSDGEGMLLDNVMFTPEPTTLLLFGLGGLVLRKRKV